MILSIGGLEVLVLEEEVFIIEFIRNVSLDYFLVMLVFEIFMLIR